MSTEMHKIRGTVSGVGGIVGRLTGQGQLGGTVTLPQIVGPPKYPGPYTVTSSLNEQVLDTSGLAMTDDVTIKEIPVVYTSNLFGGKTVVIG